MVVKRHIYTLSASWPRQEPVIHQVVSIHVTTSSLIHQFDQIWQMTNRRAPGWGLVVDSACMIIKGLGIWWENFRFWSCIKFEVRHLGCPHQISQPCNALFTRLSMTCSYEFRSFRCYICYFYINITKLRNSLFSRFQKLSSGGVTYSL